MAGNILQWIKANLLIVISTALIVILLPVGWFFSNGWNASIRENATEAFNTEKRALSSASSIEYSLPAVLKDEQELSERRAPNAIVTRFYKERKAQRERQVSEVVERGTSFNQADHAVPVQGLLPEAQSPTELRKRGLLLSELIAGTPETPSLYARLLRKLNAGDAPDPEVLANELNQYKKQQEEAYAATSSDGKISDEQAKALDQDLIKRRLGQYAGQAESIAFYCSLSAIQSETPETGTSHVPAIPYDYDSITDSLVYTWVWDYWIISDILRAVSTANTDDAGVSLAVPDAPVKHIEQIRIKEFVVNDNAASTIDPDDMGRGGRGNQGYGSDPATTSQSDDPTKINSYTGRTQNSAYDIRFVDMTLIASSKDLPKFFDALGKTNYMTVIDVDLSPVDPFEAINNGYYYGDDHLVRAHLTIETVWLRAWTTQFMPKSVKTTLGIVSESDNPDDYDG